MQLKELSVRLIARPDVNGVAMYEYLKSIDGLEWYDRVFDVDHHPSEMADVEALIEFCGRLCYRSWSEGLNPNVTRVRKDSADYFRNILSTGHGSVLEHGMFTFVVEGSRVFTHESVRHRAGTAFSQESMRFVRLDDIPFWRPEWAKADGELVHRENTLLAQMEEHQRWMAEHFGLDNDGVPFSEKKAKTSYMRRTSPQGLMTAIAFSANVRALRHIIEMRTDEGAEEEIRIIGDLIATEMVKECPLLFADYERSDTGDWVTEHRKV